MSRSTTSTLRVARDRAPRSRGAAAAARRSRRCARRGRPARATARAAGPPCASRLVLLHARVVVRRRRHTHGGAFVVQTLIGRVPALPPAPAPAPPGTTTPPVPPVPPVPAIGTTGGRSVPANGADRHTHGGVRPGRPGQGSVVVVPALPLPPAPPVPADSWANDRHTEARVQAWPAVRPIPASAAAMKRLRRSRISLRVRSSSLSTSVAAPLAPSSGSASFRSSSAIAHLAPSPASCRYPHHRHRRRLRLPRPRAHRALRSRTGTRSALFPLCHRSLLTGVTGVDRYVQTDRCACARGGRHADSRQRGGHEPVAPVEDQLARALEFVELRPFVAVLVVCVVRHASPRCASCSLRLPPRACASRARERRVDVLRHERIGKRPRAAEHPFARGAAAAVAAVLVLAAATERRRRSRGTRARRRGRAPRADRSSGRRCRRRRRSRGRARCSCGAVRPGRPRTPASRCRSRTRQSRSARSARPRSRRAGSAWCSGSACRDRARTAAPGSNAVTSCSRLGSSSATCGHRVACRAEAAERDLAHAEARATARGSRPRGPRSCA